MNRLENKRKRPFLRIPRAKEKKKTLFISIKPHAHPQIAFSKARTHQLLDNSLDQLCEIQPFDRLTVIDVFGENSNSFGIGVCSERISSFLKDEFDFLVCVGLKVISSQSVEPQQHEGFPRRKLTVCNDTIY
jgi:hypothetical protein